MIKEIKYGDSDDGIFRTLLLGDSDYITLKMDYPCGDIVNVTFYEDESFNNDLG